MGKLTLKMNLVSRRYWSTLIKLYQARRGFNHKKFTVTSINIKGLLVDILQVYLLKKYSLTFTRTTIAHLLFAKCLKNLKR